ncbi:MAG: membrane dipeptidase [Nitrospinota bacterium]|nr:MAG: membrane dipeptidase [Nitrospinota bacterium]
MTTIPAHALELHRSALVVDTHNDTLIWVLDGKRDLGIRNREGHIDIPRLREGGVKVLLCACYTPASLMPDRCASRVLKLIDTMYRLLARHPGDLTLARTVGEIEQGVQKGKIALVLTVEGGHGIEDDLGILRMFHRLGVRSMTLTHFNNNNWADGSGPHQTIPNHGGLTDFGREVIREMDRLRMIIDISHASEETFWDVLDVSTRPVIASHSNAYTLAPHHRNLKDDQIRALARRGGVIGINYFPPFLSSQASAAWEEMVESETYQQIQEEWADDLLARERAVEQLARAVIPPVPFSLILDHIDYIVNLVGVEHVGLGSDFDGISVTPQGLEDISRVPLITAGLLERGYAEADIRKILGENWLRVFREVWGA